MKIRTLIATFPVLAMTTELLSRWTGNTSLQLMAHISLCLVVAATIPKMKLREIYLLSLCIIFSVLIFTTHATPWIVMTDALNQAAFLLSFIMLMSLLHEGAATSPAVAECGEYLTRQPPGRRYFALYGGTGTMGVLFNIGIASLLIPLIQRGIALNKPDDPLNPIRERRQVSALLRGFGWSLLWSPTAIAPLALLDLIPGIDRASWMVMGLVIFIGIMLLGWLEDKIRFRAYVPQSSRIAPAVPKNAFARFFLVCLCLLGLTISLTKLSGDTVVFGMMVSCPIMLLGWLIAQNGGIGSKARAATGKRLAAVVLDNLPNSTPVAISLAFSGFVGLSAAALIPPESVGGLGLDGVPDYILLTLLPVCMALLSLLALSPIILAVFFGSLIGSMPVLPADPTLLALSISSGLALAITFSPFSSLTLLIDRISGIPNTTQTLRWNSQYTIIAAVTLIPIFAILTGGT